MVMACKNNIVFIHAINDEIKTLNTNIKIVKNLLSIKNIPYLAAKNAEKLLDVFTNIKKMFEDESESDLKKNAILEKLPLLYLQISRIKKQINIGNSHD
jgi:hypothetical protein